MNQPNPIEKRKVETDLCCLAGFQRVVAFLVMFAGAATADDLQDGIDAYLQEDYATAFRILSPAATKDNPRIQNLVGLMIYEGRGITANPVAAHDLFHDAAELRVADACRNLGILHSIGAPGVPVDYEEARMWFTSATANSYLDAAEADDGSVSIPATVINVEFKYDGDGKHTYLTFCSGCHGFSGMRFFPFAPSFAMGERMTKSSEELMQSILQGKGAMPSWEDKLTISELENVLGYLRELALRTAYGTDLSATDTSPDMFFIFGPGSIDDSFRPGWSVDPLDED